MGRLMRRIEGAVNKAVEKNVLGGHPGEVGEFRAMGGVRGFAKEVHSAAKENRDFGAPKKEEPPWHNPNLHTTQFKDTKPPWSSPSTKPKNDDPPW